MPLKDTAARDAAFHARYLRHRDEISVKRRRAREVRWHDEIAALPAFGWRDVPGWIGILQAHVSGAIRSLEPVAGRRVGRIYASKFNPHTGYVAISPRRAGKRLYLAVHRLVCLAFHGEPPTPEHQVNHKDGDKTNNAADNLEWVTPIENMEHARRLGLHDPTAPRRIKH